MIKHRSPSMESSPSSPSSQSLAPPPSPARRGEPPRSVIEAAGVVCPPSAGVASALGLLLAPARSGSGAGLRDRRRAARVTVHAGFRGSHRRMRSGRSTSGPSPGCRRESGPRGSTSGSRRGRGAKAGEPRRPALTSGPSAGGAMPARGPGSRTSPSTVGRCGRRSSIATCFAPETAFRVRQSSKSASRPPARDPGPNTTRRNGIRRRRFRRRRL